MNPTLVGNEKRAVVSELSGRGNILYKATELGLDTTREEARQVLEQIKEQAQIFPEMLYLDNDYKLEVKGIEDINGESAYKVVVNSPAGSTTEYYSVNS